MSDTVDEIDDIEWYLARDGQQFGPMSDAQLKKIVDLGHLRPTDLVWRSGMDDWDEAERVFARNGEKPGETQAAEGETQAAEGEENDAEADAAGGAEPASAPDEAGGEASDQTVEAPPAEQTAGEEQEDIAGSEGEGSQTEQAAPAQPAAEQAAEQEAEQETEQETEQAAAPVAAQAPEPSDETNDDTAAAPPPDGPQENPEGEAKPTAFAAKIGPPVPAAPSTPRDRVPPVAASPVTPAQTHNRRPPAPLAQYPAPAGRNAQGQPLLPGRGQPQPQMTGQPLPPAQYGRAPTLAAQPGLGQGAAQPAPLQRPARLPEPGSAPPFGDVKTKRAGKGRGGRHIIVVTALLLAIASVSWLAYAQSHWIIRAVGDLLASSTTADSSAGTRNETAVPGAISGPAKRAAAAREDKVVLLETPRRARPGDRETGLTAAPPIPNPLQSSALWRYIEKQFPRWYKNRAAEAALLKDELPDAHAVIRSMDVQLVVLRRKYAKYALVASRPRLRAIAASFLNTVKVMAGHSVAACYGFISHGDFSPAVVPLVKSPAYSKHLDAQNLAILKAVADGRRQGRAYQPPQPVDYRALGAELTSRGWSNADLQLFTDPVALSSAPQAKVCTMVQDWFSAQLALPDSDAQVRLLVQSLRPVIAG